MRRAQISSCLLVVALLFVLPGCQPGARNDARPTASVDLEALRTRLISTDEPEEVLEVSRLRRKLTPKDVIEGEPEPEAPPATLVVAVLGKICERKALADNPDFPWQPGKAEFMMIDTSFEPTDHASHAEGEECPFCQKKEQEAQVLVRVTDDQGEILDVDARDLFGVREGQEIVVQGTARLLAGMLMLDAESIVVREKTSS